VHRRDGGAQPGLLAACRCQAGAPADGGAQAVGGGGPGLAAAVRQLTTVSVCGSWWSSDFSQIRLTRQRFSRSGTHGAPSQLAGATGLRRALLRLSVGSVSAMPGAPAAAADADEVADDPVVGAINKLIEEGKLVNVIEDPRNAFMRAASSGGASATAKWMAGKMTRQRGANRRALAIDSPCQASDLTMCDYPGGGEVLKRYYQMNQAGKLPGPTAVGTAGLARSWTFAKPGDDATYVLYGHSDYETHQTASKNPPDTSDAHHAISQATAYVKLHDNDFFAGEELTRLIRRGNSNASTKGNVAHIPIERIPAEADGANANDPNGQDGAGAPISLEKGAKVQQVGSGVAITGRLWKSVQHRESSIWVELQDCNELKLNGGGVGKKILFKKSSTSQDATIRVGSEAGPSFEAKVTDINVYCAVLDDDSIDPRLSPVMPVEQNCSPFLACSDELRSAIHFLSALSKANAHIVAANGAAAGAASPTVKLTVALPKGKVAVTAEGFTLNEEHFKNDAKFSNLQGDVLVFHGVTIDEQVTETISSAYETCFNTMMGGAFLPVLTSKQINLTGA
jgi:hypothetical protein